MILDKYRKASSLSFETPIFVLATLHCAEQRFCVVAAQ